MNANHRKLIGALALALLVSAGAGIGLVRQGWLTPGTRGQTANAGVHADYTCPMHPQIHADHPGDCPICGMALVKKAPTATSSMTPGAQPASGTMYTCPMHPQVVSDRPGSCPICGMDLVKKAAPASSAPAPDGGASGAAGLEGVSLSPRQRVLANVETAAVQARPLARELAANGRVTYDERRLQRVSAWVGGRIDRLVVNTTGATVTRGATIATIYAPDLVSTQQEYLTALAGSRELQRSPYPELREGADRLVDAARQRLKLMGVTGAQLAHLEATRRPTISFPVSAPASGIVIDRKVQQGQYVNTGDVLYDLVDLSAVWVEANVFEADLAGVHEGQLAEVRVNAYPGKVYQGRVAFVLPALEATTRTSRVRIELANPRGELKPDMYATVRVLAPVGDGTQLAVPASAVIDTGRHQVVYVEAEPNRFVPRTVMVGTKTEGFYPVFKGLKAGEKVAVSGGFLLDASAQLTGQEGGMGDMEMKR